VTVQDLPPDAQGWDLPEPHAVALAVQPADIDAYRHVNNAVYLSWLDRAAWSHSAALGVTLERCLTISRGMAALHTQIDYVKAALAGDRVVVGTWITATDGRLRVQRRFQVRHTADGATLARACTDYVCLNLESGRAARMPAELARAYQVTARLG
jgi:acyl-CoA thioester hydrolase